jgi:hypothetical protein
MFIKLRRGRISAEKLLLSQKYLPGMFLEVTGCQPARNPANLTAIYEPIF